MARELEDDKRAIVRVIESESAAFWNKDFDAFARCWVQAPYALRIGWWSRGGISAQDGWPAIAERIGDRMAGSPSPNPNAAEVRRANLNIRVGADMAWVTFEQYGLDTGDSTMDMPGLSRETRVLEKHDGEWKIAYTSFLLTE